MGEMAKEGRWCRALMACVEAGEVKLPALVEAIGGEFFGRAIARHMQAGTEPQAAYDDLVAHAARCTAPARRYKLRKGERRWSYELREGDLVRASGSIPAKTMDNAMWTYLRIYNPAELRDVPDPAGLTFRMWEDPDA